MTLEEIKSYIAVGRDKAVCVDISWASDDLLFVRWVPILKGNRVYICFYPWGLDEGGPRFTKTFNTLEEAIVTLKRYLGKPLSDWENFNRTGNYPDGRATAQPSGDDPWHEVLSAIPEGFERLG